MLPYMLIENSTLKNVFVLWVGVVTCHECQNPENLLEYLEIGFDIHHVTMYLESKEEEEERVWEKDYLKVY